MLMIGVEWGKTPLVQGLCKFFFCETSYVFRKDINVLVVG